MNLMYLFFGKIVLTKPVDKLSPNALMEWIIFSHILASYSIKVLSPKINVHYVVFPDTSRA